MPTPLTVSEPLMSYHVLSKGLGLVIGAITAPYPRRYYTVKVCL